MALILLALIFIGTPLLEIAVFIVVGGAIGVWPTIALTVATALAGSLLLRAQGLATLMRARAQMDSGQLPAREMFEGVCLVLAGALLLVPGFVTDALGLLLFFPPFRDLLRLLIARHVAAKAARGEARIFVDGVELDPRRPRRPSVRPGDRTIEGEYEDVTGRDGGQSDGGQSDGGQGDGGQGDGGRDDGGPADDQRRLGR